MSSLSEPARDISRERLTPVQKAAVSMAIVLGVLGVLGFIPGITADYGQLAVTGIGTDAMLFGLLPVTITHNILLLLFAAALVFAASAVPVLPRLSCSDWHCSILPAPRTDSSTSATGRPYGNRPAKGISGST